ncbi:MAG: hypothetical protein U9R79_16160 [Armatimonadota bacterium]|nr:hypothetical protein [Armatimonadota bacterium]
MDMLVRGLTLAAISLVLSACLHMAGAADGDEEGPMALTTDDGLTVALNDGGEVARVALDGRSVALSEAMSGLWIRPYGGDFIPVAGTLAAEDGAVRQSRHYEGLGLRVEATYRPLGGTLACEGQIEDLTGEDRGVEVGFSLPAGGEGWRWGKSIREEVPLGAEPVE